MQRLPSNELTLVRPYFEAAAMIAGEATCDRARCGSVIVSGSEIIGQGFNGPALGAKANRTCGNEYNLSLKPKYDKTCCIHAEWRAILDACKRNASKVPGSTLYFMRIDDKGNFTDAGQPYCTTCSRLTLESGVGRFTLWNNGGADVYDAEEYNQVSYYFYSRL